MARIMVFDSETQSVSSHQRKGNPFNQDNWVIMRGWKFVGETKVSWSHHKDKDRTTCLDIPNDCVMLVGHNIKFDLHYELVQGNKSLIEFFKRGGKIWDTQYVEYLIHGMKQEVHMIRLNDLAPKYGGTEKIDAVKELWDQGVLTSDIPPDLLTDYLVGTEEEERNGGDVRNTELIFLGQFLTVKEQKQMLMVEDRMDGLLATTFMEFFGIKVDMKEATNRLIELTEKLAKADAHLQSFIPADLPFVFNWNSPIQASALVFGGAVKYKAKARYNNDDGTPARLQVDETWPVFGGEAIDPNGPLIGMDSGEPQLWYKLACGTRQDTFAGGVRKGQGKFKKVKVPGEYKEKIHEFVYDLPGLTEPRNDWQTSRLDGRGAPVFSLSGDVVKALGKRGLPFTDALANKQLLDKEIGTYYVRLDPKTGEAKGMLTCVQQWDHFIHHNLNHTSTVTSRLSASNPNMQNLPRKDEDATSGEAKSLVKRMFVSRFGNDGYMVEADYSQLEVVVQGVLTEDENLCRDLRARIDFHCKRVSAKHHISYEDAVQWCKKGVSHAALEAKGFTGGVERTKCKIFSFQRAYGAGAATIAEETGMSVDEVNALIKAEDELYPKVPLFYKRVEDSIIGSCKPFRAMNDHGQWQVFRRGTWQAPTGTIYSWRTWPADGWQLKKGVQDSFSPPEIKNYPVQGTGGEFVQGIAGRLIRHFINNDFYGGKAFIINTVHDCFWFDCHKDVYEQVARDIKKIMESIPEFYNERHGMNISVPFPVDVEYGINMNDLDHFPKGFFD